MPAISSCRSVFPFGVIYLYSLQYFLKCRSAGNQFFPLSLIRNVFISPSFLRWKIYTIWRETRISSSFSRNIFVRHKILRFQVFVFVFFGLPYSVILCSDGKIAVICVVVSLYLFCCFALVAFKIFSSSLVFRNLIIMCLFVIFIVFILLGIHLVSCVGELMFFTMLDKFQLLFFLNIFFRISLYFPLRLVLDLC